MKSIPTKNPGDQLSADDWNNPSFEVQNLIETTGITLSGGDLFQASKSTSNYAAHGDYYNETGAANAYILDTISSKKAPTAYAEGLRVRFQAANVNTGASTVNLDSLGVITIVDVNGQALNGGEIQSNKVITLVYDGTNFILADNGLTPEAIKLTKKIDGLAISNNTTDAEHDIDIAPGSFLDSLTEKLVFSSYSILTKQIDVNWAAGTDDGGFPSGLTLSADTWYHIFEISKADGTVDAGYDTSLSATNLLSDTAGSGFIYPRRIGSVLTDGSSNILPFFQFRNRFVWDTPIQSIGSVTGSMTPFTLQTPLGINTEAIINVSLQANAGGITDIVFKQTFQTGEIFGPIESSSNADRAVFNIITDTSSQISHQWQVNAPASYFVNTVGWIEIGFN